MREHQAYFTHHNTVPAKPPFSFTKYLNIANHHPDRMN